jgi:hypothetical protein
MHTGYTDDQSTAETSPAEEGPGREGKSQPGPKRSRGLGDVGNAAHNYKRRAIFVLPIAKGRRTAMALRPFSPSLSVPTPVRRRSAIATMKLRLGEGGDCREPDHDLRQKADGLVEI